MEIIKTTDDSFNSKILNLETPQPTQGGAFFTKFRLIYKHKKSPVLGFFYERK